MLTLVGAALLWASINVILKHVSGTDLHPIGVSCLLYLSALVVLVPVLAVARRQRTGNAQRLGFFRRANLIAGLAKAGETLFFVYAVKSISATQTTMLTKLSPVWVYLLLIVLYRERLRMLRLIGALLSVAGVYVLLGGVGDLLSPSGPALLGSIFAILSGLSFAVFSVSLEKDPSAEGSGNTIDGLQATVSFLGSALLFMLPFGIAFFPGRLPSLSDLLWIFLAGGVFTGATYFLYYTALTQLSSLLAVVMLSLIVAFTMLLEFLFLGTATLTVSFGIGAVVILLGVLLVANQRDVRGA